MSVQRCQVETTSTEFIDWQHYQRQEMNIHSKLDYYLARIDTTLKRVFAKDPNRIKEEDSLIEFKWEKATEPTEESIEAYSEMAAAVWAARLAMAKPQSPPQRAGT